MIFRMNEEKINLIDQESGKNLTCAERALSSTRTGLCPCLGASVLNEHEADLICVQKHQDTSGVDLHPWSHCGVEEQVSSVSKGITIPLVWKFIVDEHS